MEESSLSRGERFGAARAAVMGSFDDRCLVSGAEVTLQGVASPGGSVNTSPFRQSERTNRTVPANHFTQEAKPQKTFLKVGPSVMPHHREAPFSAVLPLDLRCRSTWINVCHCLILYQVSATL